MPANRGVICDSMGATITLTPRAIQDLSRAQPGRPPVDDQSSQSRNPPGIINNAADPPASTSPSAALLIWLILQIGALMLAAMRVPLWAHAPAGGEFLALAILGITQILAGALLSPLLNRDCRSTVIGIATVWPMLFLAGFLASASMGSVALVCAYVSSWLFLLAIWRLPLSSTGQHLTLSAIAAVWAAAGPLYPRPDDSSSESR